MSDRDRYDRLIETALAGALDAIRAFLVYEDADRGREKLARASGDLLNAARLRRSDETFARARASLDDSIVIREPTIAEAGPDEVPVYAVGQSEPVGFSNTKTGKSRWVEPGEPDPEPGKEIDR
jgi:hypothetical protein